MVAPRSGVMPWKFPSVACSKADTGPAPSVHLGWAQKLTANAKVVGGQNARWRDLKDGTAAGRLIYRKLRGDARNVVVTRHVVPSLKTGKGGPVHRL